MNCPHGQVHVQFVRRHQIWKVGQCAWRVNCVGLGHLLMKINMRHAARTCGIENKSWSLCWSYIWSMALYMVHSLFQESQVWEDST